MKQLAKVATALSVLAIVMASPVSAQPAQSPRTEVITVTPPEGWVLSVWQGGTVETGEFTPPGETGDRFVDLLGYSALPRLPVGPTDLAGLRREETEAKPEGCQASAINELSAPANWIGLARICLGRDGGSLEFAELEIAVTTVTDQGVYRIWRTHRAPFEDIWRRTGRSPIPAKDMGQIEFEAILAAWAPELAPDIERRELCDLASPEGCKAFARTLPAPFEATVQGRGGYVAAVYLEGLHQITRERFLAFFNAEDDGSPNQVIAGFLPGEIDWSDNAAVTRILTMVAYGQAADGAVLSLADPDHILNEMDRAVLRARLVAAARQLLKPDRSPSILTIAIPAS